MDLAALRAAQSALAQEVVTTVSLPPLTPRLIGGADVGFEQGGAITRAAIVLLAYPSLERVEYQVARVPTTMPYIPGLLSFRELPALLAAWQALSQKPDLMFIDGQGIAHPRHLGIASHFGVVAQIPTLGVAKKKLCGRYEPLAKEAGALQPLMGQDEQLGWVWRSKVACNPLFISPGHQCDCESALRWVQACTRGYRLPEPTRQADGIASRRAVFMRQQAITP